MCVYVAIPANVKLSTAYSIGKNVLVFCSRLFYFLLEMLETISVAMKDFPTEAYCH